MRNKLTCLLSILMIFSSAVFADEFDGGKDWGSLSNVENAWDGQKIIKNSEYEAIVNELEKRKNAKKIRAEKKAGQMLMDGSGGSESDFLSKFDEQYPLLNLTIPIKSGDVEIPVGHYKVVGTKVNGRVYLNLCQAYNVVGKIPAVETNDDFNEEEINFVKIEDVGNNVLKFIYGSMKFNAYAYTQY
ncbi:hypothetical protein IJ707_06220 [bacterium]|nr:hypothetical protein [bacterium]